MKCEPGQSLTGKYQYRIVEVIHSEADAALCMARIARTGDLVDIRLLAETAAQHFTARFQHETELLNEIDSPHIPHILDFGTDNGALFVVTENVAGLLLSQVLAETRNRPLDEALGRSYFTQLAEAVVELERHGIMDGEIRPQNIVVTPGGRLKLLGFGAVRDIGLNNYADISAALPYLAPELLQASPSAMDGRTAVYAVGAVGYEILCGHPPFDGHQLSELVRMIVLDTRPPASHYNPALPEPVDNLLAACMAKDPRDRYQTPHELRLAIAALPPANAHAVRSPAGLSTPRQRAPRLVLVSAKGRRYPLGADGGLLGRSENDPRSGPAIDLGREEHGRTVSRRQAEVRCVQGQWVIVSLPGTTNPTVQNGRALKPGALCPLHAGDELQIGGVKLVLQYEDGAANDQVER